MVRSSTAGRMLGCSVVDDAMWFAYMTTRQGVLAILITGWAAWASTGIAAAADLEVMKAATVKITVVHDGGTAFGSGIVLCQDGDRAVVLTARHVVSGLGATLAGGARSQRFAGVSELAVAFRRDVIPPVRGAWELFRVRDAKTKDLALLVVPGVTRRLVSAELGSSADVATEDSVRSIGHSVAAGREWLLLAGAISEVDEFVLHDTRIDSGYSGGPLYDTRGRVVAVNVQTIGPVARAIPIEEAVRTFRSRLPAGCLDPAEQEPVEADVPPATTPPPPPPTDPKVAAGAVLTDRGIGMRFRGIPSGRFTMGSPADEAGRYDREGPQHEVRFAKGFWLGETEVTQAQWRQVMGDNPSHFSACGDDCPVENVNWYQAMAFTNKLSALAGLEECFELAGEEVTFRGPSCSGYRLPTEEEWEYAARAGTSTAYWSGSTESDLARVGWYSGNSDRKTHAVKDKAQANAWGLHDVHGNVWEWTLSPWIDAHAGRSGGINVDPLRPDAAATAPGGVGRVVRGGGYWSTARSARSACRVSGDPDDRNQNQGFRVLLPVAPSS